MHTNKKISINNSIKVIFRNQKYNDFNKNKLRRKPTIKIYNKCD